MEDLIEAVFALACAWLNPASASWRFVALPANSENEPASTVSLPAPAASARESASSQAPVLPQEAVSATASLQETAASEASASEAASSKAATVPAQVTEAPSRAALARAYDNLLSCGGCGAQVVLPIESLYRPWTEDVHCHLPFRSEKGYVGGDSALHLQSILQELGVDASQLGGLQPDHLAVELNVLGLLLEEDASAAQHFVQDHLAWIDDFWQAAQKRWEPTSESAYYLELINATRICTRMCMQACIQMPARMCTGAPQRPMPSQDLCPAS